MNPLEAEDDFCLDEARETLFTLQRACERHSAVLGKVVEALNSKQPDDEWLLDVLDEAAKGKAFHEQQLQLFTTFHERAHAYVEAVRNEANQLAFQELAGGNGQPEDGEGSGGGDEASTSGSAAAADSDAAAATATAMPAGQRRKSSKIVHPELLKFKLEKQAKILGKYGGTPALGAGLVLPRLQRDSILKATGSPAAREIHYSKVEKKDASNLAEVMRFKVRKGEDDAANGGIPAPSPWQAELSAKKGKSALDGTDQKDQVTPSTRSHAVYAEELGGVLQQRQAALEEAMEAHKATPAAADAGPKISADAMGELAEKLRRRQSAAKQMEEAEAAAAAEAAEAEAPATTPAWSNAAAPFGGELTAALQRRAEQQRQPTSSGGGSGDGRGGPEASASAVPQPGAAAAAGQVKPLATPSPTARQPGARPSGASASTSSAAPATPAGGFVTPAGAPRRSTPPTGGMSGMASTPPGAAAAANNELQEKLRRRLSALDGQTPSPPPPPPPAS
ncbi:hypothetical protein PLESTB_000566200 [Pleodorina starrii]|uniref:Uncharacterized protein n=1 Tax=Pleodorina starrii TaxID=330485 RepID=A0A9W6BI60_9CHLO|nr:hypothetical protein PLESTM_000291400 [Pleodorina starrii]GLC51951.1 hypothetical protein PLESTB_000566200 [Pleodorina starrii]GLC68529.1 hypothetical protein PLESTF_000702000 [Pleodorina starrii]